MADNVYEVLLSNHRSLVREVLDKNEDISKFLMLVYSHTLYTASDRNLGDPQDIYFTYNIGEKEDRELIKIDLKYKTGVGSSSLDGKNPIKRNFNLVRLCEVNKDVRDLAPRTVELLGKWIDRKPYRRAFGIEAVMLHNGMFWHNLIFTAEIMLKIQWEEMVKAKQKFFDEEDLKGEHPMVEGGYVI